MLYVFNEHKLKPSNQRENKMKLKLPTFKQAKKWLANMLDKFFYMVAGNDEQMLAELKEKKWHGIAKEWAVLYIAGIVTLILLVVL